MKIQLGALYIHIHRDGSVFFFVLPEDTDDYAFLILSTEETLFEAQINGREFFLG